MSKNIPQQQFRKATRDADPYAKYMIDADDTRKWYVLLDGIEGKDNEFLGGQYLLRMEMPADFPFNPPMFYFMTPNGICKTDTNPCISIGSYHKEDYRPTLGVSGFVNNLVSSFIGWRELHGGINILVSGDEKRDVASIKLHAAASVEYNERHHSDIVKCIHESYDHYKKNFNLTEPNKPCYVTEDTRKKLQLGEFAATGSSQSN